MLRPSAEEEGRVGWIELFFDLIYTGSTGHRATLSKGNRTDVTAGVIAAATGVSSNPVADMSRPATGPDWAMAHMAPAANPSSWVQTTAVGRGETTRKRFVA